MSKPHIRRIAANYVVRVGSGSTPHEAWLYCVWGEQ